MSCSDNPVTFLVLLFFELYFPSAGKYMSKQVDWLLFPFMFTLSCMKLWIQLEKRIFLYTWKNIKYFIRSTILHFDHSLVLWRKDEHFFVDQYNNHRNCHSFCIINRIHSFILSLGGEREAERISGGKGWETEDAWNRFQNFYFTDSRKGLPSFLSDTLPFSSFYEWGNKVHTPFPNSISQ